MIDECNGDSWYLCQNNKYYKVYNIILTGNT